MKKATVFLLALAMLLGIFGAVPALAEETTTIVWYVPGSMPENYDSVMAAVNEKLAPHGLQLDLQIVEFGDYDQKMQLISAARQDCDIMWVSSWLNRYDNNISNGAIMAIDEYLPEVPELDALLSNYWQYLKVGGKLYGVPVLQIMADQPGIVFDRALVEKYDIDVTTVKDYRDLDAIFEIIAENEPGIYPAANNSPTYDMQFWNEETGEYDLYPKIEDYYIDTETMQVMETEARLGIERDLAAKRREWAVKGWMHPDIATMTDKDSVWTSGKAFAKYSRVKPGNVAEWMRGYKLDVIEQPIGEAYISVGSVQSTINAIASSSKHPVEALKLLELVNTDVELYNMIIFGLEGQDYERVDETHIATIDGAYGVGAWTIGNQFNAYLTVEQEDGIWEETIALNESATPDPLGDFVFDRSNVESQMANIYAIREEYKPILDYGLDEADKTIDEREAKLATAGQDEVIAELNRQLAEWAAAQ